MAYTVLARRYRSQDFDELIGQEVIARTLQRAIETGRTAHAYLFCGTRGVGKTSMARLFAKALNVTPDLTQSRQIADAIMQGSDIDVIEIDGASNRGIEEARDLIANCIYRPSRSPYKIYIIDEVHMLTREAFNALLKTMEEPPEHVKFILCTTEPHKVPATIQSRCQRFDFRSIPTRRIAEHLRSVLAHEKISAEDSVIFQVARLGNGSMRDALSVLDRLLASGESKITAQTLEEAIGLPGAALVDAIVMAVAGADASGALAGVTEMVDSGHSLDQMIEVLIGRLHTLLLVTTCGIDHEMVDLSDDERVEAGTLAQKFDAPALVYMIALLENVQRGIKSSSTPRALVDAAMVRLALSEKFIDAAEALSSSHSSGSGVNGYPATGSKKKAHPVGADEVKIHTVPRDAAGINQSISREHFSSGTGSPQQASSPASGDGEARWRDFLHRVAQRDNLAMFSEAIELVGDPENLEPAPASPAEGSATLLPPIRVRLAITDPALFPFARMKFSQLGEVLSQTLGRPARIELVEVKQQIGSPSHQQVEDDHQDGARRRSAEAAQANPPMPQRRDAAGSERMEAAARLGAARPEMPALQTQDIDEAMRIPVVRLAMEWLDARVVQVDEAGPPGTPAGLNSENEEARGMAPEASDGSDIE